MEVRQLIASQDYTKAIEMVYREGLLEREVMDHELPALTADLILSDVCARWDLTK